MLTYGNVNICSVIYITCSCKKDETRNAVADANVYANAVGLRRSLILCFRNAAVVGVTGLSCPGGDGLSQIFFC